MDIEERSIKEIIALDRIYPSDLVFAMEVRRVVNDIRKHNLRKEIGESQRYDEILKNVSVGDLLQASIKKDKENKKI